MGLADGQRRDGQRERGQQAGRGPVRPAGNVKRTVRTAAEAETIRPARYADEGSAWTAPWRVPKPNRAPAPSAAAKR